MIRRLAMLVVAGWLGQAWSGSSWAAETPEPEVEDRQERQEQLIELHCRDDQDRPESWLDRSHAYMSQRLCEPAAWFDGFFGDPRALEETPVGTFIRLRNALQWDESEGWSLGVRVRANIELPRVSDRVRLLISRDDDLSGDLRDGPSVEDNDERTRLGLRFIASEQEQAQLDLDGTVRVSSGGLNPRIRGRYRYVTGLTATTLLRATQTAFWEREDGLGISSRLDWEWLPNRYRLIRLSARGTFSEESEGVDWRTSAIAYRQLDLRTALRTEIGAFGYTRPDFDVEEYFIAVRLRRQFARPWLFYEIQPEYAWPLDELTKERGSDWRLTLTLEIQFENKRSREQRMRRYWGENPENIDWDAAEDPIPVGPSGDSWFPEPAEHPDMDQEDRDEEGQDKRPDEG
ncbi:MAG: hypothetical protein V2J20_05555 [Wenzhouxiangella sp.]|jgi:hypothetical protein|nr:hypothetical protein [Wenzhouxiangella sp.]